MAYPRYVKERARQLRQQQGLTIDELVERLAIPRSTVYGWVGDIPIGRTESRRVASRRAGEVTRRIHRAKREAAYTEGWEEYPSLVLEPTFRDFVCMYIGEGSKRSRNVVAICNSDPAVVRLGAHWMRRLAANPVRFSFQHHADQDPQAVRNFWSLVVDVEPDEIAFQRKSNSGRLAGRAWRSPHGVLAIRTNDTYLRARLQAWMDSLRNEWP